jgi:hypothetical protein
MNNSRFATLLAALVVFAIVAGTWFLGVVPRLSEADSAASERSNVEVQNQAHQAELDRLAALNDRLPELRLQEEEIRTAIPGEPAAARFYRELEAISAATGIRFSTVSLGAPTPYQVDESADGLPPLDVNAEVATAMGSVDATNFFTLALQLGMTGTYSGVVEAIAMLQNSPRFVLVHGVSIDEGIPGGDAPVKANLDAQLFVLLSAEDVPEVVAVEEIAPEVSTE